MKTNQFTSFFCLALISAFLSINASLNALEGDSSKVGQRTEISELGVSSNPGSVNIETGTGVLGETLGFSKESGVRLGGLWIGDMNYLITGGFKPKNWSGNNLFQLALSLDSEKLNLWKGGLFEIEFLQFNGRATNADAGAVQGYNSLTVTPPLDRSELYQLWFRQEFFEKKLIIRIGKMVTILDFNNVIKPLPLTDAGLAIPATTSLAYTPIFVNTTLLGATPGYYNSAYGIFASYVPDDRLYVSYAAYDGNLARGKQTGLRGPQFNQYCFQITEVGCAWGLKDMPGNLSLGVWHQSGKLKIPHVTERGTGGLYLFGTQRLWRRNPGVDNSGIIGLIQFGINNSKTLPMQRYYGAGLTFLGLVPERFDDSFGFGVATSKLNRHLFPRRNEWMYQGYYQAFLFEGAYFQSALSYIPKPGAGKHLSHVWAATARIIALF